VKLAYHSCLWSLAAVALLAVPAHAAAAAPIATTNYAGGETIRYPVPMIRGTLADKTLTAVEVVNETSRRGTARMQCQAHNGQFKAITELVPGKNRIVLKAGKNQVALELTYTPQTNPYIVRIVYATDKTGDTTYQTPLKDDAQDYAGKLGTMMLLMQTFTAERMNDMGLGRRTFNLEFDADGKVKVHLLRCDKTADEIYSMGGGRAALYAYLNKQLDRQLPHPTAKNVILPAFSRFVPETKRNVAYTALGGGNLALFGGSNMYCYPRNLADVQRAFLDATRIDTANFSSDSVGRHTFWACASTSIGATLHELGHTLDLPHCRSGWGIMLRGGDFFNRFWVLTEPSPRSGQPPQEVNETRNAQWTLESAAFLRATRWLALDAREYTKTGRITARLGRNADEIVVESPDGIGAVCLGSPGSMATAVPMDYSQPAPKSVTVNVKQFAKDLEGEKAWLRVIDTDGHVKNVPQREFIPAAAQKKDARAADRPNILFCLADDWGPGPAGVFGDRYIKTPTFDRVAREGVLLTQAYVAVPSCTGSRAAILTGQMPHRLGAAMNLSCDWTDIPPLYTDLLSDAGYHVGYMQKGWSPGAHSGRKLNPCGVSYKNFPAFLAQRPAGAPFCFWFGSYDPHRGYDRGLAEKEGVSPDAVRVPPFLPDVPEVRQDLADYCAEVQRFDRDVGQMLDRLAKSGELENTIVVMAGDNGMPFPRAKGHLYDSGTHMPLAIRWGRNPKPGRVVTDFISFADFAPTFLAAAGLKLPAVMTGRSFLDLLQSNKAGRLDPSRDRVFTERERHTWCHPEGRSYPSRALRTDRWLYICNFRPQLYPAGHPALRRPGGNPKGCVDCDEGPSKYYVIDHKDDPRIAPSYARSFDLRPAEELYDIAADPDQLKNLALDAKYATTLAGLRADLEQWMKRTADPRAAGETDRWDAPCKHLQPRADVKMPGYDEPQRRGAENRAP